MNNPLEKLSARIGYTFADESLLVLALTHRSKSAKNNERLEFLGDSILNFTIAEALFHQFPEEKEGVLSRLRASLVKGDTLAEVARDFDLGDFLLLGGGELKSGGFRRDSILADAVEAIIGAIYLDSGMPEASARILDWYSQRLKDITTESLKDPKTRLQEYQQGRKSRLPDYTVVNTDGPDNERIFTVECRIPELDEAVVATGPSRRIAEQSAALSALKILGLAEDLS